MFVNSLKIVLGEEKHSLPRTVFVLTVGIMFGFVLFGLVTYSSSRIPWLPWYHRPGQFPPILSDSLSWHDLEGVEGPEQEVGNHAAHEEVHALENSTLANKLYREVRILCWIMTNPSNHKAKALHVKRTWGKRCNKILFMSSTVDPLLNTIALPVKEGRDNLWAKTKEAFKYIYKHHLDDADWFYKADDDTYAVLENLRYLLYPYSPSYPIHFGCKFKMEVKQGYMSGGAGYVLSKEAVRRFIEEAIPNKNCRQDNGGSEDVEIGKCLELVNVEAGDSRDSLGRNRFFPMAPEHHLIPNNGKKQWYWITQFYKTDDGMEYCSDNAISFHYVSPNQMYVLEYLIYHLRPYGIVPHPQSLPEKLHVGHVLPARNFSSSTTTEVIQVNKNTTKSENKEATTTTIIPIDIKSLRRTVRISRIETADGPTRPTTGRATVPQDDETIQYNRVRTEVKSVPSSLPTIPPNLKPEPPPAIVIHQHQHSTFSRNYEQRIVGHVVVASAMQQMSEHFGSKAESIAKAVASDDELSCMTNLLGDGDDEMYRILGGKRLGQQTVAHKGTVPKKKQSWEAWSSNCGAKRFCCSVRGDDLVPKAVTAFCVQSLRR
nr:LOW QUALITY PROTEIN: glycoprotein-N-acetylgalactosamine 3-beta-galactosyltransferase 1 [Aedes albopictus]